MNEKELNAIRDYILHLHQQLKHAVRDDIAEGTLHYVNHDEYEMALEMILLGAMELDRCLPFNYKDATEVAKTLRLHEETVYDAEFWPRFEAFVAKNDPVVVRDFIEKLMLQLQPLLEKSAHEEAWHYLTYGEYEMALEGALFNMMTLDKPPSIDWERTTEVAKSLLLQEETVIDSDFWSKYEAYKAKHG